MMQPLRAHIKGLAPLLMHSDQGVDPLDPLRIELAKYTSKRTKSEEDHKTISWLEWRLNAYLDQNDEFVIPTRNIHACMRDAAKRTKKGKIVDQAIVFDKVEEAILFDFDGSKNGLEDLYKSGEFVDRRSVGNQKNRVMRTRPKFDNWELKFNLEFDDSSLNRRDLIEILDNAGRYVGLGDYRPTFGRFEVLSAD